MKNPSDRGAFSIAKGALLGLNKTLKVVYSMAFEPEYCFLKALFLV